VVSTNVARASYRPQDGPKAPADLRNSLWTGTRCSMNNFGEAAAFSGIKAAAEPRLGDEAVAVDLTMSVPGDETSGPVGSPWTYLVVRSVPR
jgi:hypothetical protein